MATRIPIHKANNGMVVTPHNAGNIFPDPLYNFRSSGFFLPCNCLDLCEVVQANGGTMVGLKFEVAVVPNKSKLESLFIENLATCPGVTVKITYEDVLGAEIEALLPMASVPFTDEWCEVDTSTMYHFDTSGENGYLGRGDIGLIAIEILTDAENTLVEKCCSGAGTCDQPMMQWAIKYDPAKIVRNGLSICDGKSIECVDCPPQAMVDAFDASVRKTELGL